MLTMLLLTLTIRQKLSLKKKHMLIVFRRKSKHNKIKNPNIIKMNLVIRKSESKFINNIRGTR